MTANGPSYRSQFILGDTTPPTLQAKHWWIGIGFAVIMHLAAAYPFLPDPQPTTLAVASENEGPSIAVNLAPVIQPPEPPPQQIEQEEPEPEKLEERASDSPPPAPPAKPREIPDLPDIQPKAVPDLWRGGGGSGGTLSLNEYLALKGWLNEARRSILERLCYPFEARRDGISGHAVVNITVRRNGKIVEWDFYRRTGHSILDREITKTLDSSRRLPDFPEGTAHDVLAFALPIRFELVFGDTPRARAEAAEAAQRAAERQDNGQAPAAPAGPAEDELSVSDMSRCAGKAATLISERDRIQARQTALQSQSTEYADQLERYNRRDRDPPSRFRRQLEDFNETVEAFDAEIEGFQAQAASFSSQCGAGRANWNTYQRACLPYIPAGNAYCEAYGDFWARLKAGG